MTKRRVQTNARTCNVNSVYVLIDPRYGPEKHSSWSFSGRPFYVGRSYKIEARYDEHTNVVEAHKYRSLKNNTVRKIKSEGFIPRMRVIKRNLSMKEANELKQALKSVQ